LGINLYSKNSILQKSVIQNTVPNEIICGRTCLWPQMYFVIWQPYCTQSGSIMKTFSEHLEWVDFVLVSLVEKSLAKELLENFFSI